MTNVEKYLVSRLKGVLEEVLTFDNRLYDDHTKEQGLARRIVEFRKENPQATFETIKNDLVQYRQLGIFNALMLEDYYKSLEVLKELYAAVKLNNITIDLKEEEKNFLEVVSEKYVRRFTVDKGEIKFVDKDEEQNLQQTLAGEKDETYQNIFNSPRLTPTI